MANRTRGQRVGLTRAAILEAAVRIVDRDGLARLSMRRLGAEVGVEAMTLYHHFTNKDAVLDGLVEHVFARPSLSLAHGESWQDGMRAYARALRDTLLEHPNLMPVVVERPAVTPETLRLMEDGLATLAGAGFAPGDALDIVYTLNGFVLGAAAIAPSADEPRPQVDRFAGLSAERFPLIAEAAAEAAGPGRPDRFDFALDALFTGFAALLARP